MNANQVMAAPNPASRQIKGASRVSAREKGALDLSVGGREQPFHHVLAKSQTQGGISQDAEQTVKAMESLAEETAVLEKSLKHMEEKPKGTTGEDAEPGSEKAAEAVNVPVITGTSGEFREKQPGDPDESTAGIATVPMGSIGTELSLIQLTTGMIQDVSSPYGNLQSLLPQSEEQGAKRQQMLAMLSGQVIQSGSGESRETAPLPQQTVKASLEMVPEPLSAQPPQMARNLTMPVDSADPAGGRKEAQGEASVPQFVAANAAGTAQSSPGSISIQSYLQASRNPAMNQPLQGQQPSQDSESSVGVQVLVEDLRVPGAQDIPQQPMGRENPFHQQRQSFTQQGAVPQDTGEESFGQQMTAPREGGSQREAVPRGNKEESSEGMPGERAEALMSQREAVSRGSTGESSEGRTGMPGERTEALMSQRGRTPSEGAAVLSAEQKAMPLESTEAPLGRQAQRREYGPVGDSQGMFRRAEAPSLDQQPVGSRNAEGQLFEPIQDRGAVHPPEQGQTAGGYQQAVQEMGNASSASQTGSQAAPQVRDPFDVAGQIVEQARLIRARESTEMVIHLKPEHLGNLTLRVSVAENGAVTASFYSDNAHVRSIVENSLVQLRQDLENQGLKVDKAEVYAGLSDGQLPQGQGQQAWQQDQGQGSPAQDIRSLRGGLDSFADTASEFSAAAQEHAGAEDEGVDYRV